jgi:RNA polymerase sigma-70 factor (ECF subfamily)
VTSAERVALLLSHLDAGKRDEVAAIGHLEATLETQLAEIGVTFPALKIDEDRYVTALAGKLAARSGEDAERVIRTMPAPDLYLAAACAAGDTAALALFREQLIPPLRQVLGKLGAPAATIDEAVQRILVMVLVGEGGPPQIGTYSGRGRLRSWIRSVGVRTGRRLMGLYHGGDDDGDELDELPGAVRDPELELLRARYAGEVKTAFARALDSLTDRQRNVLRQYYIDELTIDQLGALYHVNRATAARWVAGARLAIVTRTRELLVGELGIGTSEADSIIRLVRSQLSLSIRELA